MFKGEGGKEDKEAEQAFESLKAETNNSLSTSAPARNCASLSPFPWLTFPLRQVPTYQGREIITTSSPRLSHPLFQHNNNNPPQSLLLTPIPSASTIPAREQAHVQEKKRKTSSPSPAASFGVRAERPMSRGREKKKSLELLLRGSSPRKDQAETESAAPRVLPRPGVGCLRGGYSRPPGGGGRGAHPGAARTKQGKPDTHRENP